MKKTSAAVSAIIIVLIVLFSGIIVSQLQNKKPARVYLGVTYTGNTVEGGKMLIDKVKAYTNLFVLQSGLLQRDFNSVNELGDYAIAAGMYFLPYFGNFVQLSFSEWLENAKQRWGDRLLGVYHSDEPAGKMLDDYVTFDSTLLGESITKTPYGDVVLQKINGIVINYDLEGAIHLYEPIANSDINSEKVFFPNGSIQIINPALNGFSYHSYEELQTFRPFKDLDEITEGFYNLDKSNIEFLSNSTTIFTSDYALEWFDYKAGFDVVLAQVGWNLTLAQQIAPVRGAAIMQNKSWGIIITWKYQQPPYLANGNELFTQMKTAYECGAKYIVLFNYYGDSSSTYGTMEQQHFDALQSFYQDFVQSPNDNWNSIKADSVVVLPHNYGFGGRWMDDHIWGIFKPDNKTRHIWFVMQDALQAHGLKTDIVYADPDYLIPTSYVNVYHTDNS
jgi:hypothetical protein